MVVLQIKFNLFLESKMLYSSKSALPSPDNSSSVSSGAPQVGLVGLPVVVLVVAVVVVLVVAVVVLVVVVVVVVEVVVCPTCGY